MHRSCFIINGILGTCNNDLLCALDTVSPSVVMSLPLIFGLHPGMSQFDPKEERMLSILYPLKQQFVIAYDQLCCFNAYPQNLFSVGGAWSV